MTAATTAVVPFLAVLGYYRRRVGRVVNDLSVTLDLAHAKVALSDGAWFGEPGRGFARLNFATSRALLDTILARLDDALRARAR